MFAVLLRILLFSLLIYYLVKLATNILFPFREGRNADRNDNSGDRRKEGEVSIDHVPGKDSSRKKDDGEYVDYEEVE